MKIHKEGCHHKDTLENDLQRRLPEGIRCKCICTCPEQSPDPQPSALQSVIEELPDTWTSDEAGLRRMMWDKIQEIIKEINRINKK